MSRLQEIIIEVDGMTGAESERAVADRLSALPGVRAVEVSHPEGHAVVTADLALATPERLRSAVAEAGFVPGEVVFPE
jgi:copper chaperone CopZ